PSASSLSLHDALPIWHGIKRALHRAAAIVTVSEASRRAILERCPEAAERTFVTLSGVSREFHPVPRDSLRLAELGMRPDRPFVLTVGQYAPYKNHEGALRGFAHAFSDRTDVDFVLVQRMGENTARLLQLASTLGLSGRVRLLRPVSRQDLIQLYSTAAALLHPSFCEGFGNPLAEAMACGCPVVTSDISAMPEVTGAAAALASPDNPEAIGNALRRVVEEKDEAERMR